MPNCLLQAKQTARRESIASAHSDSQEDGSLLSPATVPTSMVPPLAAAGSSHQQQPTPGSVFGLTPTFSAAAGSKDGGFVFDCAMDDSVALCWPVPCVMSAVVEYGDY